MAFGRNSSNLPLAGGSTFTVPFVTDGVQYFFKFPIDVTLTGIAANFNNFDAFIPIAGSSFTPYIAIATADPGTYNFTISPTSITYAADSYLAGVNNPSTTILTAAQNSLNVEIPAETLISIVGGWSNLGTPQALQIFIYMAGTLFFTGS